MFRINKSDQFLVRNNNNNKWEFQTKNNKTTCKHSFVDVKSLINNWFENPDNNEYSKICPKCDEVSLMQTRYNRFLDRKSLTKRTIGFRFNANNPKELEDADDFLFDGADKISTYYLDTSSFYIFYLLKYLDDDLILQKDIKAITTPDVQRKISELIENAGSPLFYEGQDLFLFDQIPTYEMFRSQKTFPEDRLFARVGTTTTTTNVIKELDMDELENIITTDKEEFVRKFDNKGDDRKELDISEKQLFGIKRNLFDNKTISRKKLEEIIMSSDNNNNKDINDRCVEIDKTDGSLIFSCYDKIHKKINYIFKIDTNSNITVNHSRKDFEKKRNLGQDFSNVDYTNNDNTESTINEIVVSSILSSAYTFSLRDTTKFCNHFPKTFGFYIKNINNQYDTDSLSILHEYLLPVNILEKFNLLYIKQEDIGVEESERYRFKLIEKLLFEITFSVAFMQISVDECVMHNNLKISNIKARHRRRYYEEAKYVAPDEAFYLQYKYDNKEGESTNPAKYYLQNIEYQFVMTNFTKATLNPPSEKIKGVFMFHESRVEKSLWNDYGGGVSKFEPGYDILTFYLDLLFQLKNGPLLPKTNNSNQRPTTPKVSFLANHTKTQDLFFNIFLNMASFVVKNIEKNGTATEKEDFKTSGFKFYLENIDPRTMMEIDRNTGKQQSLVDFSSIEDLWDYLMKDGRIATVETLVMPDGEKIKYVNVKHNTFVTQWWRPENVLSRDSNVFEGLRRREDNSKLFKLYSEIRIQKPWYIKD